MRDIKFRAWDIQRHEFLSGGEVFIAIQPGRRPQNTIYLDIIKDPDKYKDRFVLQQCTGLKDKNGKEIYEGDIVHCWGGEHCQGYWEHDSKIVINNMINDCFMMGEHEFFEVIGNIYENPELLQQE